MWESCGSMDQHVKRGKLARPPAEGMAIEPRNTLPSWAAYFVVPLVGLELHACV
jgi:hypothetical protein